MIRRKYRVAIAYRGPTIESIEDFQRIKQTSRLMHEAVKDVLLVVLSPLIGALSALITARIVEQTKLRHRLIVENEYLILARIWKKAYWLKSRAGNLRPVLDHVDPNETEKVRRERRLDLFLKALNRFEEEMFLNKPFYPQEIYPILKDLRSTAINEGLDYAHASPDAKGYWDESEENTTKINEIVEQLCDLMRSRLIDRKLITTIKK